MEKIKKLRSTERTAVTKGICSLETQLKTKPLDKTTLQATFELLQGHLQKLTELDDKVKDLLLDAEDTSDEAFQKECDTIEEYATRAALIRVKLEAVLYPQAPGSPRSSVYGSQVSNQGNKRNFKLPRIELKKYNGELKSWLGWWAQFSKIHEDEELHDADKFHYLDQCMIKGTRAADLVASFPHSAENYEKVIKALQERYGKPKLLQQVYVRELISMITSNRNKEKVPLSTLYDRLESHLRSLETLGLTMQLMEVVLLPMVESILPEEILLAWQRSSDFGKDGSVLDPPVSELSFLMQFVKKEIDNEEQRKLARSGFGATTDKKGFVREQEATGENNPTAAGLFNGATSNPKLCLFCEKSHESRDCNAAQKMTLEQRKDTLKSKGACFRCLKTGHMAVKCKVKVTCVVCERRHYPLLCPGSNGQKTKDERSVPALLANLNCTSEVYLRTLMVQVINPLTQKNRNVRVLLDCGSQRSYILRTTAKALGLKAIESLQVNHQLFGGTEVTGARHGLFQVTLRSLNGSQSLSLNVMDQGKICAEVPRYAWGSWLDELKTTGIQFSDVDPRNALEIEILLGADYLGEILTGGILKLSNGLTATETVFGWTLMGKRKKTESLAMSVFSMTVSSSTVSDLWDLEVIGIRDPSEIKSKELRDKEVQSHFENTVTISQDGRYSVSLPWVGDSCELPSNRSVAMKRLESTTKKLNSLDKFSDYDAIFQEWEKEGIISVVTEREAKDQNCHFLPHRAVLKNSATTPVRPVFDASCKIGRSPSLNNCLEKGPNLLELIPSILLRFRMGTIGAIADIRKAFLQIEVKQDDRRFLQFFWWEDNTAQKVKVFQHNRVVFGVNSSPFLLAAVVSHHLRQLRVSYPELLLKIESSLYVDNLVVSVNSDEEYDEIKKIATESLSQAKMELRQWERTGVIGENQVTNVLGLRWDKLKDSFLFNEVPFKVPELITKRVILSLLQSVFDPLGYLCPVLIIPKILLQQAWIENRKWDEEVSEELRSNFRSWWTELFSVLPEIKIPRNCNGGNQVQDQRYQLHVFSDASQKAYAAAVFLRVETVGGVEVQLLQAKTRVAPVHKVSIPRLELLSCTVATRLAESVKKALSFENVLTTYWTDSTTALSWIRRNDDWGTFVGNRVKEICKLSKTEQWRHVPGASNPADLPSRGIRPSKFVELRWWEGPEWLKLDEKMWPRSQEKVDEHLVNEERRRGIVTLLTASGLSRPWYVPFNNYHKNLCVMAFVFRFLNLLKKKTTEKSSRPTAEEIVHTELRLFKIVQSEVFPSGEPTVCGLKVEIDNFGLLRVVTKLLHRQDSDMFKRPVLLPSTHILVDQLVTHEHTINSHGGAQFLMSTLREKVWIVHGRKTIKKSIRSCVVCRRFEAKKSQVPSSSLPQDRVQSAGAFQTTGIDLAGPLTLKNGDKCYLVLFTCATYRAIHIELVDFMTTEDFVLSFIRFTKRMRRPDVIYTDNGTNLVGANNLFATIDWQKVERETQQERISWIFNPPSAPWWGGWWERLIRTTKDLLRRMLGFRKLTRVELETSICQVQAVVNDRPLTFVTEDQDDLIPLTPSMFLREMSTCELPEAGVITVDSLAGKKKKMTSLFEEIKKRFRSEYLGILVQRGKEKTREFKVGEIVLVEMEHHKRVFWPMARIIELIPGKDGQVRVAKVKTKNGILTRPIQRLFPLEVDIGTISPIPDPDEETRTEDPVQVTIENVETKTRSGRKVKRPVRFCDQ